MLCRKDREHGERKLKKKINKKKKMKEEGDEQIELFGSSHLHLGIFLRTGVMRLVVLKRKKNKKINLKGQQFSCSTLGLVGWFIISLFSFIKT